MEISPVRLSQAKGMVGRTKVRGGNVLGYLRMSQEVSVAAEVKSVGGS